MTALSSRARRRSLSKKGRKSSFEGDGQWRLAADDGRDLTLIQGAERLTGDHPFLVGADDQHPHRRIIGGDVVKAPLVIVSPSVVGMAGNNILTRSAALPGDLIAVTGYLGSSAAGLRMLKAGLELDEETASYLRQAHLCPVPRVGEGELLAQHGVRAAIDLSDGLVADLDKICQASKVGARVMTNRVPIHPLVQAAFEQDSLRLALSGGEDYELLFTARGDVIEGTKSLMSSPVMVIGEVVAEPGQVTLLDEEGKAMEWEGGGWEHFRDERFA